MKESNFHSDEFEQLIREKTEQYKMYPSENVWKGVHNSLHTKRKWFIGSMAFLVTGILFFSGRELLAPGHPATRKLAASLGSIDSASADQARAGQPENNSRSNFVRLHTVNSGSAAGRHANNAGAGGAEQGEIDQPYNHLAITIGHPVVSQPDLSELLSHAVQLPGEAPSLIAAREVVMGNMPKPSEPSQPEPGLLQSWLVRNAPENSGAHRVGDAAAARNSSEALRDPGESGRDAGEIAASKELSQEFGGEDAEVRDVLESLSARGQQRANTYHHLARQQSAHAGSVAGPIRDSSGVAKVSTDEVGEESDNSRVNWLHDYAVYTLERTPNRGRWFVQLDLSPTINFRNLMGGAMASSKQLGGGTATDLRPGNMESWVDRSPGFGFEFGGNVLYRATRNLTLKAGILFDYSRYKMLAYTTATQQQQQPTYRTPLGNYLYVDSVFAAAPASLNGFTGFQNPVQATLYNDYFQLAAPIGFELRVLGNERLQFNIGASIQPSYLLNTNAFIVTSDYTNYTKEPSVFRRWNLTGGVEAFLSYQTGPIRWQVGPEFRYQLFSAYNSGPYPISENLRGYGLKIGITKPLP